MPSRFDANYHDPNIAWDPLIDDVFEELTSSFLVMPRGEGFIDYPVFEKGYQALKRQTNAFSSTTPDAILAAVQEFPIAFVVFRCILGLSPPEWAYITTSSTNTDVSQGAARTIDRNIRLNPLEWSTETNEINDERINAMILVGVDLVHGGAGPVTPDAIHRLDKSDTKYGQPSLQSVAGLGAPYPVLLYERLLGRPFATHRDSVSELVGRVVENAVESALNDASISYRDTKRAERIPGFDQAPDFIIPDEFTPVAVIEAKLTEDDGTARDKVARVQRLRTLRDEAGKDYDVIACIAGRGFKVRREDMRRLLQATDGKVFTLSTMSLLIENTRIAEYAVGKFTKRR